MTSQSYEMASSNSAGTKDWMERTKGMIVGAYVGTEAESAETFTQEVFEEALKKVSRRIDPSELGKASSGT